VCLAKESSVSELTKPHVLDWKELRRTVMTLNLAIAQIDLSMTEGEYSIDTLIDSFGFMRSELDKLNRIVHEDGIDVETVKAALAAQSEILTDKVSASIIAFQFYDKLSQRLHHVSESLSALIDIISSEDTVIDEESWERFLGKMAKYASMREEYELFDLIFERGRSAQDAISELRERLNERLKAAKEKHKSRVTDDEDDIELF
jgi:hypothetical protein